MAQPSGTLVFKNRTRCHCARGVHVGQGFVTQTPALYPNLQSASQALQMDLQKHAQPHQTVTQIQMLQCTSRWGASRHELSCATFYDGEPIRRTDGMEVAQWC